jgi:hypothetical protein
MLYLSRRSRCSRHRLLLTSSWEIEGWMLIKKICRHPGENHEELFCTMNYNTGAIGMGNQPGL